MGKQEKYQETDTESESSGEEEDEEPEKWRRHYPSKHRIQTFCSALNLVSTTADTQGAYNIAKKYSNGVGNARELEEKGGLVLYEVDAIEMSQRNFLRTQ
ncbi:hypothetical protein Peur_070343 [Populus x canadensis]